MSINKVRREEYMSRKYMANLALCIVLGGLVIFSVTQVGSALTPKGLFVSELELSHQAEKMKQDVVLTKYQIVKTVKNNMVEADFYIRNDSVHDINNVSVSCDFFDENRKFRDRMVWKSAETIPGQNLVKITSVSRRYMNTNVKNSACLITDFQLVKNSFFTLDRHTEEGHGNAAEEGGHDKQAPAGH